MSENELLRTLTRIADLLGKCGHRPVGSPLGMLLELRDRTRWLSGSEPDLYRGFYRDLGEVFGGMGSVLDMTLPCASHQADLEELTTKLFELYKRGRERYEA